MAKKATSPEGKAELSARQLTILEFIKSSSDSQGYAPSMREIGDAAGLNSPASVKYQLDILEEKGFIRRDENRGRAMEVVLPDHMTGESASTDKTRFIPLVGSIAAGVPITADQQVEETLPLPESLVGKGDLFMLKVKGESMIDGEATVKTFSRKGGHIWLLPANDDFAPIDGDNCEILGKVTAVLRSI